MRVGRTFMALNIVWYDVKSASLSGWEYLIMLRGLGFKSYVCLLCVIWFIIILLIYLWIVSDIIIIGL